MAVPPEFINDLRQRVAISDVVGRRIKLVKKGRRFVGLCPFHSEKTPSFSVVDDEGFYHCFGCGAHGDVISFLREIDGLNFLEAIERIAEIAGLSVPKTDVVDPKILEKRQAAFDILEIVAQSFETELEDDSGLAAKKYLVQRGFDIAALKSYRLGYAPRTGLQGLLHKKGFSERDMESVGVIRKSDRDGKYYDYFRDRLVFPIENRQGKVIAFGGRALGDFQPKYLNSPEGPTFSKKSMLYGWVQAREAVRKGLRLVVAEGYLDVIAIHCSGVAGAVSPLGTALTPEQISLLWKLCDEPIICFDGDSAGQRAQQRAIENILPILEPGKSIRFAILPNGKDPDDLIHSEGADAFKEILMAAHSLIDSLWTCSQENIDLSVPEARAQFWQSVRKHARSIGNNQVRKAFGDEIEGRIVKMRGLTRGLNQIATSSRFVKRPKTGLASRHKAILALILAHPALIVTNFEALSRLDSGDKELESLKKALINAVIRDPDLDAGALKYHLKSLNLEKVLALITGDDMKARLPFDPTELSNDKAAGYLDELIQLAHGRSGLFSQMSSFKS